MLKIGIKNEEQIIVNNENLASFIQSGNLDVFATPSLVALAEKTAYKSVENELENGFSSVGILVNFTHIAPTPLGVKISCKSELVKIDGRKLTFKIVIFDEFEKIGEGFHERFIINTDKFMEKLKNKTTS